MSDENSELEDIVNVDEGSEMPTDIKTEGVILKGGKKIKFRSIRTFRKSKKGGKRSKKSKGGKKGRKSRKGGKRGRKSRK